MLENTYNLHSSQEIEDKEDWYGRILFRTSISFHSIGISAGDLMVLDYTWEEVSEMMDDFKRECFRVVLTDSDGQESIVLFSGAIPDLEDVLDPGDII